MDAGIYLRISLDATGERLGVTRQDGDCLDLSARRGWDVVDTYTDNDKSAKKAGKREEFNRLLRDIESGRIKVVVAWNFDRLLRNDREKLKFIEVGAKHGIIISLVRGPEIDLSTAVGKMLAGVLAEVARFEIEIKSERHQSGNLQKAQAGKPHASRRPFGYTLGYTAIIETEAAAYREMVRLRLSGRNCHDIALWLAKEKICTTTGRPFLPLTVYNMLCSPRYAGIRRYKGVDHPGIWEPLIDTETWERLQLVVRLSSEQYGNAPRPRRYLLTGKIYCGNCKNPLNGTIKATQQGKKVPTYACYCVATVNRPKGCGLRRNAIAVDHFVREQVLTRLETPDLAKLLQDDSPDDGELRELLDRRDLQQQRLDEIIRDFAKLGLNLSQLATVKRTAEDELQSIQKDIDALNRRRTATGRIPVGQTLREAWHKSNSNTWRRELLDLVVEKVIVHPSQLKPFYLADGVRCRFDQNAIEIIYREALT